MSHEYILSIILLLLIVYLGYDYKFIQPKKRRKQEDERLKNIYKDALREYDKEKEE